MWVNADEPQGHAVAEAVQVLNSGQLLVAPTETRYGLLARSDNVAALESLFHAKGRASETPVSVFVKDEQGIAELGEINHAARALLRHHLPGPLTLVLNARPALKAPIAVNGKIGIRYSSSPLIREIIRKMDVPLTATSANLSGGPESVRISEITILFRDQVGLYLDCGDLINPVSSVVDCSVDPPTMLRSGAISESSIRETLKAL